MGLEFPTAIQMLWELMRLYDWRIITYKDSNVNVESNILSTNFLSYLLALSLEAANRKGNKR